MDTILDPESLIFSVALAVGVGLSLIQVVTTMLGLSGDGHDLLGGKEFGIGKDVGLHKEVGIGKDAPDGFETDGVMGTLLSALGVGRAPFIVVLMLFSASFGVSGLAVQGLMSETFGGTAPWYLALFPALFAAVPATGGLSRLFARLVPREVTNVQTRAGLVGRSGRIIVGTAAAGHPAEARVIDATGHRQIVMVEPLDGSPDLVEGTDVVLVRQRGSFFDAVADPAVAS